MDNFQHIWRGQLLVGMQDVGQATIWTTHNSYLPPIGWKLKMTYITEYSDLWNKVLEAEPTLLSRESCTKINNKYVSLFTLTSSTLEFSQLTKELSETNKTRIILTSILKNNVEITLIPPCKETRRLGMWMPPKEHHPFLYVVLISKTSPKKDMLKHKKNYLSVMSKMGKTSTPDPKKPDFGEQKVQNDKSTGVKLGNIDLKELEDTKKELKDRVRKDEKLDFSASTDQHKSRGKEEEEKHGERKKERKNTGSDDNTYINEKSHKEEISVPEKNERKEERKDDLKVVHQKGRSGKSPFKYQDKRDQECKLQKTSKFKDKCDSNSTIKHVLEKMKKNGEKASQKTVGSFLRTYVKVGKTKVVGGDPDVVAMKTDSKEHRTEIGHSKGFPISDKTFTKNVFLDTKKLKSVFDSNAKKRPDLIKPSMLKRSLKGNIEQSLKQVTPDIILSSEVGKILPDVTPSLSTQSEKTVLEAQNEEVTEDVQKRKRSVKSLLKTTIKSLTSIPSETEETNLKQNLGVNSCKNKDLDSNVMILVSPSRDSGCENTASLDSTIKSQEILKIPEDSISAAKKEIQGSVHSHFSDVTSTPSHNCKESEVLDIELEKEKNEIDYSCELEKNNKNNVMHALGSFKEFITSKLGNKRKSEGLEKGFKELESPSKKIRMTFPEQDLIRTPEPSCYPDIFRNIKDKYRKSLKDLAVRMSDDEKSEELKPYDSDGSQPELLEITLPHAEDGCILLEKKGPDDKIMSYLERINVNENSGEIIEPLNTYMQDSRSRQSMKDSTGNEECSLADTVSWKGPVQETDNRSAPHPQEGKQYLLDMFLGSVPKEDITDSKAMSMYEKENLQDRESTENVYEHHLEKNLIQSNTSLNMQDQFLVSETFIIPKASPDPLPPLIEDAENVDEIQIPRLVINDELESYDQFSVEQDGIRYQMIPDEVYVEDRSQISFHVNTDEQTFNSVQDGNQNYMLNYQRAFADELLVNEQPLSTDNLSTYEEPTVVRLFPENTITHAIAQSSPKLVTDIMKKEPKSGDSPCDYLPDLPKSGDSPCDYLPDLPPLQRLSDLRAAKFKMPLPLLDPIKPRRKIGQVNHSSKLYNQTDIVADDSGFPVMGGNSSNSEISMSSVVKPYPKIGDHGQEEQPNLEEFGEASGDMLDFSIGSGRCQGFSEQESSSCAANRSSMEIDVGSESTSIATISSPTKTCIIDQKRTLLPKTQGTSCIGSQLKEKSVYEESHVLQQLKTRIGLWQSDGDGKASKAIMQGIATLSDFMKHGTVITSDVNTHEKVTECSKQMKETLLKSILPESKSNHSVYELDSRKVIAVKCKEKCCSDTGTYSDSASSDDSVEALRLGRVIKSKIALLLFQNPEDKRWEDTETGISKSELKSSKYLHLFDANENDIMKTKYFCRAHQVTYVTMNDLAANGGHILIQDNALPKLFSAPDFLTWCQQPDIKFGVYTSLSALLKNKVSPILTSKWLFLLHHTAMVDPQLEMVLALVLDDLRHDNNHHHQIVIPILTLKIGYCCLVNSNTTEKSEHLMGRILQKNFMLLIKCLRSGAAKIISGDCSWGNLGPESPVIEHLQCLKVLHCNYKLAHRYASLLVGNGVQSVTNRNDYYTIQTVGKLNQILESEKC